MVDGALDHAVTRLDLTEFRCFETLRLEVEAAPVVLTGANGAGKTNLLEAISLLAPGRGLRRARLAEVGRLGAARPWGVAARVRAPGRETAVGTALEVPLPGPPRPEAEAARAGEDGDDGDDGGVQRRVVRIDGVAEPQAALAGALSLSWLVPQMDRLFVDGAGGRRGFLDRLAYGFDAGHAKRAGAYERLLRQRARLLRDGVRDAAWLAALEQTMAEHAVAVGAARRDALARLESGLAMSLGAFPGVRLELEGWVERALEREPALAVEGALRERWAAARELDAAAGRTALGVHRTDLLAWHGTNGMPARQCSTGEQKALLVAIVLAHARVLAAHQGYPPILLLDEVAAHLDRERRASLFEELLAMRAQAWLSGTDAAPFAALGGSARFLEIGDGRVGAVPGAAAR